MQNLALVQEMPRGEAYVTEPVAESVFTASEKGPESCQRSPFHTAVNPLEDEFVAGSWDAPITIQNVLLTHEDLTPSTSSLPGRARAGSVL
jgi:hypothetical protein